MFGLLMGDENLQVVKVALAVVTPWALELLVEVWVSLALLRHGCRLKGGVFNRHAKLADCELVSRGGEEQVKERP
jgi:hypothetical protein